MHRTAVACLAAFFQALADIVMRDDGRLLLEKFVPARMVFMVMRVDDEAHRLVGNALERLLNSFRQRCVLIVDNHDAVIADRSANVASRSHQHINTAGDFRDFDLNFAEVMILSKAKASRETSEYCDTRGSAHGSHP